MTGKKKDLLNKAYKEFFDIMLNSYAHKDLKDIVVDDVMGFGTTIDEKVFNLAGLQELVIRQKEQSKDIDISVDITPVHQIFSANEDIAIYVDEITINMQLSEGKNEFTVRISTVLEYINDKWKVIHWHGSKPVETEGDTWHKEEWKQRNAELEKLVKEKTADLEKTLEHLKNTQAQLIHAEKMASLGELTAGIAHEIQNPLNFVNNFSEVSVDLIKDMAEEISAGNTEEFKAIADDLIQNLEKIHHHGKRASNIVNGMLEHSRAGDGTKEPADINEMADEYLRLAYHGLRAKDNSFNADFKTNLDKNLQKINIVPQDIGRVLLNLINNAFYSCAERSRSTLNENKEYKPLVSVSTLADGNKVIVKVADNGNGIPSDVKDKIFQPFFTTKAAGEGTGLGLSLSYDIITKGHGGELKVESKENEGTEFTILLPIN